MTRPPGRAKPRESALESLAERGRREVAAQLVVVGEHGSDHVAIVRRQAIERLERLAYELAFLERVPAVECDVVFCGVLAAAPDPPACGPRLPRRDRQDPAQGIARAVVAGQLTEQLHERVLRDILGEHW